MGGWIAASANNRGFEVTGVISVECHLNEGFLIVTSFGLATSIRDKQQDLSNQVERTDNEHLTARHFRHHFHTESP